MVMSAPVLARWMVSTRSAVGATPSDSMSTTWPPIMPGARPVSMSPKRPMPVPTATETSRRMATTVGGGRGQLRDGLEGERLQRVAGEDGDGFAEGDVAGGMAAAQVVVVERGQVVVDERVGVQHLQRRAEVGDAGGQLAVAGDHARGFHAEDRAQAFAAGEDAVAHGAVDGVGQRLGRGQKSFEGCVGERDARGEQRSYRGIHQTSMINDAAMRRTARRRGSRRAIRAMLLEARVASAIQRGRIWRTLRHFWRGSSGSRRSILPATRACLRGFARARARAHW